MTGQRLHVFFGQRPVGELALDAAGKLAWRYLGAWRRDPGAFPVSVSLPLDGEPARPDAAANFFANLLPEGTVRQRICQALRISPTNDFELLRAIGGDCAGALTITAEEQPPPVGNDYEAVTPRQLAAWSVGAPDAFSAITGRRDVRLSLAGAQDKLPVKFDGQRFLVPRGNSPSTHLLKFASPHWSHLPENEVFTTWLAEAAGLPAVRIRLATSTRARFAVVERYDRVRQGETFARLHQEDFCQALGISAANKYEKEGGPTLAACCQVLREHASLPAAEIRKLLRWALFNWLAGNADGHAKNLSLLFLPGGQIELAPFYDLVCTRNYRQLDRLLAMKIGGEADPGQLGPKNIGQLARDLGVGPRLVRDELAGLAERLVAALPAVVERFDAEAGNSPVLQRLPRIVRTLVRRAKTGVAE